MAGSSDADMRGAAFASAMIDRFGERAFSVAVRQVRLSNDTQPHVRQAWYEIAAHIAARPLVFRP